MRVTCAVLMALGLAPRIPAASIPAQPERTVHFSVFSAIPITDLCFLPQRGSSPRPVEFYPTARSPAYEYRGSDVLEFRQGPATADTDFKARALLAQVSMPPGLLHVLLLFVPLVPAPATGLRYRIEVMDDGGASHAAGGLRIANFSGRALGGTIDGRPLVLKTGLNPVLGVGRSAAVALRTPFRGRSYPAFTETVELAPGERALLILFPPYRAGSLEVQSRLLLDRPPSPELLPGKR